MEVERFAEMLRDRHFTDLKKLRYKYPEDFDAFLAALRATCWRELPIADFEGKPLIVTENPSGIDFGAAKLLLRPQRGSYGLKAAEDEISASSRIEDIDFSRESIRDVLRGTAPRDEAENRILGQKRALEFIGDVRSRITEENLHSLYMMAVGDYLGPEERLSEGERYRDDAVFVVSDRPEHMGLNHRLLPEYMARLVAFINAEDGMDELVKAAVIHFYFAYLHPYFDGNGRMARLLHLWYLVQRGFRTALFVPVSGYIARTRREYYGAFTLCEENRRISGRLDATPFVRYFAESVYNKLPGGEPGSDTMELYGEAIAAGELTPKETELWRFVLAAYGTGEFSTKRLERDFGNAAYATIRAFVLKLTRLGLLSSASYGSRVRYRVR